MDSSDETVTEDDEYCSGVIEVFNNVEDLRYGNSILLIVMKNLMKTMKVKNLVNF